MIPSANIEHSDDSSILHQRDYISEIHALPITFLREIRDKDELNIEKNKRTNFVKKTSGSVQLAVKSITT